VRLIAVLLMLLSASWASVGAGAADPSRSGPTAPDAARLARTDAATLIMVDNPACQYCRRWNKEVGAGYARTPEGRAAPLKRVGRNSKALSGLAPVVYTPTFILVREGREVGRITGYPGQFFFWEELSALLASAGLAAKG